MSELPPTWNRLERRSPSTNILSSGCTIRESLAALFATKSPAGNANRSCDRRSAEFRWAAALIWRRSPSPQFATWHRQRCRHRNSHFLFPPKLNKSVRSPSAGLFDGAYGSVTLGIGLGRLSRLLSVIGGSAQLYSMNLRIET